MSGLRQTRLQRRPRMETWIRTQSALCTADGVGAIPAPSFFKKQTARPSIETTIGTAFSFAGHSSEGGGRSTSRSGRLPIPEPLWASGAEVAREHGVFHTAKVLRLEYGTLKRMAPSARPMAKTAAPAFVELVAPPTGGLSECLIELEGRHGKMRIPGERDHRAGSG